MMPTLPDDKIGNSLQNNVNSQAKLAGKQDGELDTAQDVAKVFMSGNSQAVRLPRAYRFDDSIEQLEIKKVGDSLVLTPKDNTNNSWAKRVDDWFCTLDDLNIEVPEDLLDKERAGLADLEFHEDWFK